ncbi:MAG: MFS transporter [Curvibacter sp. RIFCSPHIGHO2_12_FULL_63_18]|uniref:YbfB/YjiJ family MFS transporter n=1 Tax=Rhodoferax sp. TaxID=50421 RepID=UPI0008C8AE0B|nr:YbfB/YjiJ family MFS transporter [Rhodoferax sp.]OGO95165.1 MAG: MFS transporter [Curvibacter sp. GWA2_63_95]OGP05233.1 MAG: MFS transporter [Curvibacter sp. RIFCSPHIGHO2_12_FULL_63_18]HCX80136.1 MFS transporter [Rhodoferax sp.]
MRQTWALALALSLGAAVSLGITRFAYGLLLPAMRTDLGWTYTLAGAMNTANALGYFLGALATPMLMRRVGPSALLWGGAVLASAFMGLSGFFTDAQPLLLQRLLAGVASALVFIAGGLLAARLGARHPQHSGLLLGIYYGGTGLGIVLSALLVPWLLDATQAQLHGWRWAWWVLALACLLASMALVWPARVMARWDAPAATVGTAMQDFRWRQFGFGLAGYTLFGVGYIGYMTFVVALLRAQGSSALAVTVFYALLGLAVVASSRIWAGLLDRHKGGRALATLNVLLGVATVLPALTRWWPVVLVSGLLFGGVFLSVVASTTALVRHNLPPAAWAAGISAFTTVFAAGQIVGPTVVGWIADGPGGLARGLVFSAVALWLGAALAIRQKALV